MSFELRPATSEDAEALVDLQLAAWRAAFIPLLPPGFRLPGRVVGLCEELGFRPDGATQSRATFVGTREIRYRRPL